MSCRGLCRVLAAVVSLSTHVPFSHAADHAVHRPPSEAARCDQFIVETYENRRYTGRNLFVLINIDDPHAVQWTTVFLDGHARTIGRNMDVPVAARWDDEVRDVKVESESFSLKLQFYDEVHAVTVYLDRAANVCRLKSTGSREDYGTGRPVSLSWKSIYGVSVPDRAGR